MTMATIRRYYERIDLDRSSAVIRSLFERDGRKAVLLDETIFYPEGGGQPADRGTINGVPVTDVQEEGNEVLHFVEGSLASSLIPGPADLVLDAARRRDFAVQHTAQHLLSATILRLTGFPTLSMRLGDLYSTIDVDASELPATDLAQIEDAAFSVIEADYPIITHLCPPEDIAAFPLRKRPPTDENVIRVLEIDGYDYSPCCGTHLRSTGKIGVLKILGVERYKGMTRVTFVAGKRALLDYRLVRDAAAAAGSALKTPPEGIAETVRGLIEKSSAQDRTILNLRETLAAHEASRLLASGTAVIAHCYGDRNIDEALRVGRAAQKSTEAVIIVASAPDRKAAVLSAGKDVDLRPLMKALLESHRGKGGGGPSFQQAAFDSKADLDSFMAAAAAAFAKGDR